MHPRVLHRPPRCYVFEISCERRLIAFVASAVRRATRAVPLEFRGGAATADSLVQVALTIGSSLEASVVKHKRAESSCD